MGGFMQKKAAALCGFVAAAVVCLIGCCEGRTFAVGWVVAPSEKYNVWSGRNRFLVNDILNFKYQKGQDSVLVVSKDDYYNCNTDNPIRKLDTGNDEFKLDRSGPFFFISGLKPNCQMDQRLVVVVLSLRRLPSPPLPLPPTAASPTPLISAAPTPTISPSAAFSPGPTAFSAGPTVFSAGPAAFSPGPTPGSIESGVPAGSPGSADGGGGVAVAPAPSEAGVKLRGSMVGAVVVVALMVILNLNGI